VANGHNIFQMLLVLSAIEISWPIVSLRVSVRVRVTVFEKTCATTQKER